MHQHTQGEAGIGGRVSGHSLRIGAAQSLAERDVSLAELQRAGRWKSPAMPGYYVRGQEASRGAVPRLRGGVRKSPEKGLRRPERRCQVRLTRVNRLILLRLL